MLTAQTAHTGKGLGRRLISATEEKARAINCTAMRLEVLMPVEWQHPKKVILIDWYIRQGYTFVEDEDFGKNYPQI